jgi:hypothetical protein
MIVCTSCQRHVRVSGRCPFCGAEIVIERREPRMRSSRAVRILGVAAIGAACGGTTVPTDGGTGDATNDYSPMPMYGAPPLADSGKPPVADASDAGESTDAESNDAADADDGDATNVALYGAPPPPED